MFLCRSGLVFPQSVSTFILCIDVCQYMHLLRLTFRILFLHSVPSHEVPGCEMSSIPQTERNALICIESRLFYVEYSGRSLDFGSLYFHIALQIAVKKPRGSGSHVCKHMQHENVHTKIRYQCSGLRCQVEFTMKYIEGQLLFYLFLLLLAFSSFHSVPLNGRICLFNLLYSDQV